MGKYLVVANQTLQGVELREELRKRIGEGASSFYVLVPDTSAAEYLDIPAEGDVLLPKMAWWMTDYHRPANDEEATAQARQRLDQMLADLAALGVPVEGELGSPRPLEAIGEACTDRQFDEIIVATLPRHLSRWLRADVPHQAERRFKIPVTTLITKRPPASRWPEIPDTADVRDRPHV
jgi:nucleotide-binding universal stress UspA family protein